jgi:hypothetical protein
VSDATGCPAALNSAAIFPVDRVVQHNATGIGALVGVPADIYGGYQVFTGFFRGMRGVNQMVDAINNPVVHKTPLRYAADLALGVVPFGNGITDWIGGLP